MKKLTSLLLAALMLTAAVPLSGAAPADSGLNLSCASCLLMEKETGTVLLEENAHDKLEPASVTKIMTLLLVMEAVDSGRIRLDDPVTVSAYAAGMGGSQVYLEEGEQMPVSEMIKCVTVVSGNDCSVGSEMCIRDSSSLGQRLFRSSGRAFGRQRGGLCGPNEPAGPGAGDE